MRNVIPLVGLGCALIIILGVIVGGIVMIGSGVGDFFEKKAPETKQNSGPNAPPSQKAVPKEARTLLDARKTHATQLLQSDFARSGLDLPVVPDAKIVYYKSPAGNMAAYLSNPPKKFPRKPAVVWAHDGFGGITADDWTKAKAFHDAGFVLMVPSFREENVNNGGSFEMFYGEVDDLLAAVDFVSKQEGVDPNRIYVVGNGTGGTLALLAATSGARSVRAYFAIGGTPSVEETLRIPNMKPPGGVSPPFDTKNAAETYLRSAFPFVGSIRQPTFFFGASSSNASECDQATRMEGAAMQHSAPFRAFIIPRAQQANFAAPLIQLIRQKIEGDRIGQVSSIRFENSEVVQPFNK